MSFIADLLFVQGHIATPAAIAAVTGESLVDYQAKAESAAPTREPRVVLTPEISS